MNRIKNPLEWIGDSAFATNKPQEEHIGAPARPGLFKRIPGLVFQLARGVLQQSPAGPLVKIAGLGDMEDPIQQPRTAGETAANEVGKIIGFTTTMGLGSAFVAPRVAATEAPFAVRLATQLPKLAAQGTALTASDILKDVVYRDANTGTIVKQVAFNYIVPAAAEAVLVKAFPRVYTEPVQRTAGVLYKRAGKIVGTEEALQEPFSEAWKRADAASKAFPGAQIDYPSLVDAHAATIEHITYPLATEPQAFAQNVETYGGAISRIGKGILDEIKRAEDRLRYGLSLSTTPPENAEPINLIGGLTANLMGKGMKESAQAVGSAKAELRQFATEFNEAFGRNAEDYWRQVPHYVNGILRGDVNTETIHPLVIKAGDWFIAKDAQIAQAYADAGVKLFDPITKKSYDFTELAGHFPQYHNFNEIAKVLQRAQTIDSAGNITPMGELQKQMFNMLYRAEKASTPSASAGTVSWDWIMSKLRQTRTKSLYTRADIPGWNDNPLEVLPGYFEDAYKKVYMHGLMEKPINSVLPNYASNKPTRQVLSEALHELGGNTGLYNQIVESYMGLTPQDKTLVGRASSLLRGWNIIKYMPLSAITNVAGEIPLVSMFGKKAIDELQRLATSSAVRKEAYNFAETAGALAFDAAKIADSEDVPLVGHVLRAYGFTPVENFLRVHSAVTARRFVTDTLESAEKGTRALTEADTRLLTKLGVNIPEALERLKTAGDIDPHTLLDAGYYGAKLTQFTNDVLSSPVFQQSALGKTFMQLRSFSYQAAHFIKEQVVDEAAKGNWKPVTRILALAPLIGEGVNDLKDLMRLRNPLSRSEEQINALGISSFEPLRAVGLDVEPGGWKEKLLNRVIDNVLLAGTLGVWLDAAQAFGSQGMQNILGPSFSTLQGAWQGGQEVIGAGQAALGEQVGTVTPEQAEKKKTNIYSMLTDLASQFAVVGGGSIGNIAAKARVFKGIPKAFVAPGRVEQERGLFASDRDKFGAVVSDVEKLKSKASTKINIALSDGDTDKAMDIASRYNGEVQQLYATKLQQYGVSARDVAKATRSMIITPREVSLRYRSQLRQAAISSKITQSQRILERVEQAAQAFGLAR